MIILIVIWNFFVFLLYGIDKLKAIHNSWRISEKALILSSLLFGGIGAFAGMSFFKHKTRHLKFKIILPITFIYTIASLVALSKI